MTHSLPCSVPLPGRVLLSQAVSINTETTLLLDDRSCVLFCNPAAHVMLGSAATDLLGQDVVTVVHPDDQAVLTGFLQRRPVNPPDEEVRVRIRRAGGAWLWVSASSVSFLNEPNVQATSLQFRTEQRLQDEQHAALWEIAQVLNSTYELAEVVSTVLSRTLQGVGADAGSVCLLSADGQHLELVGNSGFSSQASSPWTRFPVGLRTPITDVARDRQAMFLTAGEFQARYPDIHQQHSKAFQSAAMLPLIVHHRPLGVLTLSFQQDRTFHAQDRLFLKAVADLCAPALDRSRLYHELQRQEEWTRTVNFNSSDIATVIDAQGVIRYASGSVERLLGYSTTELLGRNIDSLIHPDDLLPVQQSLARLSTGSDPVAATFRCLHRDGHWVWLESIASDLKRQPHVSGVLVNSRDVSAREEARMAQQEILERLTVSERNFRRLARHASDLVREYAPDGRVVYVSESARDLLGYESEELLGPDPLGHVHGDDLPALEAAFLRRFTDPLEHQKFEYRLRRRDGTFVWVETVFKAVRDPATQTVTAFIGTSRDIDQRKRAEQHLNVQLDRYHKLLEFTASLEQLHDPTALTAGALHRSLELTEYDYAYAFAWSETGLTFETQAGLRSADIGDFMETLRLHTFTPAALQALANGEAYYTLDDQALLDPPEALPRRDWRSACLLPVLRQGTPVALLVFGSSSPMTCSQDTRQLLQNVAARLSHALERHHHLGQLSTSREETLRALGLALEYRDYETKGHTDRVLLLTERLGRALNFLPADQDALRWGAFLHDTGKVAIPDDILLKPGELTPEEWTLIRRHPTIGYEMLHHIPSLPPATLEVVLYHQERWNGSGYPDGLQGQQIPLSARVFAVVDVYDALTSCRPYKPAWSHQEAAEQLRLEAGVLLDEFVVRTFLNLFEPDGSFRTVALGDG